MRFWDGYKGSSFLELLAIEHPQLQPDVKRWFSELGQLPPTSHGTTCIGLRFAEGALVAGDRLATIGYQVASREIEKVYATDEYSVMAIAGAAGPAIEMARLLGIQFEHHEKIEGEALKEEMDALMDEIDEVLEENAEEFVKNYVQRGGE